MKKLFLLSLISAFLFAISSCTVTKRHFRPGYHVEWNKKDRTEKETLTKTEILTKTEVEKESKSESELETNTLTESKTKPETLTIGESNSEGTVEAISSEVDIQEENTTDEISLLESGRKKDLKSIEPRDPKSDDSDYILRIVLGIILVIFIGPMFIVFGILIFILMLLAFESITISNNYALTEAIAIGLGSALMIAYYTTGFYLIFLLFSRKEMDPVRYKQRRNLQWLIALIGALFLSALVLLGFYFA